MTVHDALLASAIQQARAVLTSLEALVQLRHEEKPVCLHPEEKVVRAGTMGHMSRFCTVCEQELPGSLPDNPGGST